MVKEEDKDTAKRRENQGKAECPLPASKIWHTQQRTVIAVSG